ncbi:MAG: DOMON-like domain-containing protein [Sphingomonas sp.]|nr:DOMON-like domain-containing protein [Sphingomonas sp.]
MVAMGGATCRPVGGDFLPVPHPFALSLSKGCLSLYRGEEGQGFDKLSPNGGLVLYDLIPHPQFSAPDFVISVEAARSVEGTLAIRYVVGGHTDRILIPQPVGYASRHPDLWRHTCFEAFVAAGEGADYLEFNFAPSTAWDAFKFASYRVSGGSFSFSSPHVDVERSEGSLEVTVALDMTATPEADASATWHLNLSAVIEEIDGTKSYWALAHAPGPPDFHNRDCFIATLPAPERS